MATKRYYKAIEVEALLQGTREKENFTGVAEKTAIKTILETAQRNGRIGDKVLLVIPTKYIHIPRWQRKLDMSRAREIGMKYNKYKWEVPKVIYHNGRLYCVDGMHRIVGAFVGNIECVVVEVLIDMTEKEAIELFLNQTADRSKMKPCDYYYASIEVGKPEYITFRDICHANNVQIKGDDYLNNPVGTFTSVSDGKELAKQNPELLDSILKLICKLQWNGNATVTGIDKCFGSRYVRALKKLYSYYPDHTKEMEKIIIDNCKGAEWFMNNAINKTQAVLFDDLSKIVQKGLNEKKITLKAVS